MPFCLQCPTDQQSFYFHRTLLATLHMTHMLQLCGAVKYCAASHSLQKQSAPYILMQILSSLYSSGADGLELHLTPDVLADIFQCNITRLDNPRIQASNPDLRYGTSVSKPYQRKSAEVTSRS